MQACGGEYVRAGQAPPPNQAPQTESVATPLFHFIVDKEQQAVVDIVFRYLSVCCPVILRVGCGGSSWWKT